MAKQTINIGSSANDGTGSSLRAGGDLINDNFNEIYTALGDGSSISSAAFVTTTGTQTLTNKTVDLGDNTLTGSLAEFNTALQGDSFVSLTGSETLTNKTLTDVVAITNSVTGEIVPGKFEGTNFTGSLLVGHATTGTLNAASANTGVGIHSLKRVTTGDNNTMIGYNSGQSIIDGRHNTGLGRESANSITSGLYNINIGYQSGQNITSGDGNVIIGSVVNADSATGDRQLKIAGHDGSTTTTWISGDSSGNLTFPANVTTSGNAIITGDLTVNGTTTTVSSTNTTVTDNLLELNSGASSNANDTGIIMERGSTGDNAIFAWDESADKFIVGTTTATASDTGDLSIATGTLVANIEGNVTGNVTGNADTATALATGRTIGMTGDVVWTSASFDGSGNVTGTAAIQANTISSTELVSATTLLIVDSTGSTVKTIIGAGS